MRVQQGMRIVRRDPDRTRTALVNAAYNEIHRYGYQGMRVGAVLRSTGMGKGAFYHHFRSKRDLAFAVIDEVIATRVVKYWTGGLPGVADPIDAIISLLQSAVRDLTREDLELGCPLCNLAQEMSPIDEEFRNRLSRVHRDWVSGFRQALLDGQRRGRVREAVDCERSAAFLVAALHGCIASAKAAQDPRQLQQCAQELVSYLETLRP